MDQRKFIIGLILMFTNLSCFATNKYSFTIETMEGAKRKIDVYYKSASGKLTIACSSDKIFLDSYSATKDIQVLNHKFLKIAYSDLGGTGIENVKTAILVMRKNKLVVCAFFTSYYKVSSINKQFLSESNFRLSVDNNKKYKLITDNVEKSENVSKMNTAGSNSDTLYFDRNAYVFRTGYEFKSKNFNVYDPETDQQKNLFVSGKIPVISLIGFKFDFIYGEWYQEDDKGNLYKCTYR